MINVNNITQTMDFGPALWWKCTLYVFLALSFLVFPSYLQEQQHQTEGNHDYRRNNMWVGLYNFTSPAIEVLANCQDNEEDQCNHDAENDELHLHILPPHLLSYLCSLFSEILCLHAKLKDESGDSQIDGTNRFHMRSMIWTCDRRSSVLSTSSSIFSPRSST